MLVGRFCNLLLTSVVLPAEPSFSVNPMPAISETENPMDLEPGQSVPHHSEYTSNTIGSSVKLDQDSYERSDAYPGGAPTRDTSSSEQTFSVNPIPATSGYGNPVNLAPGESVPHHSNFTSNTVNSNVKLDQESYERSDAYPGGAPSQDTSSSVSAFSVPPAYGTMIPESSLPMGSEANFEQYSGPQIRSGGGATSTAELAGQVPKEQRGVPSVVTESQQTAHASPEAAASAEAVAEKREVEQELLSKVPTQEGTTTESEYYTGGSQNTGGSYGTTDSLAGQVPQEPRGVPSVVTESQQAADVPPEASASSEAVSEKKQVEQELLSKVPTQDGISSTGQGNADSSITTSQNTDQVPEIVRDSEFDAGTTGGATANPTAVAEKEEVEDELRSKVPEAPATAESGSIVGRYATNAAATVSSFLPTSIQHAIDEMSHGHNPLASTHSTSGPITGSNVPGRYGATDRSATSDPTSSAPSGGILSSILPTSVQHALSDITHGHNPLASHHPTADSTTANTTSYDTTDRSANPDSTTPSAGGITSYLPTSVQNAVTDISEGRNPLASTSSTSDPRLDSYDTTDRSATSDSNGEVPSAVTDSIREAQVSPEAASNPEAVSEKSQVERELLSEIKPVTESGEPAPTASASLSSSAPGTTSTSEEYSSTPGGQGSSRVGYSSTFGGYGSAEYGSTSVAGQTSGTGQTSSISDASVPSAVQESIAQADRSPEAAANPQAVEEKASVEDELLSKISPSQASGESAPRISTGGTFASTADTGSATTTGYVSSAAAKVSSYLPESVQRAIDEMSHGHNPLASTSSTSDAPSTSTATVPSAVQDSIRQSDQDPEATANPQAVREKAGVERELLSEISPSHATGEPAPSAASGISSYLPTSVQNAATSVSQSVQDTATTVSQSVQNAAANISQGRNPLASTTLTSEYHDSSMDNVPSAVQNSIRQSDFEPEAAANPQAVEEKADVESELLSQVETSQASGEPAPSASGATSTSTTGAGFGGSSTDYNASSTGYDGSSTSYPERSNGYTAANTGSYTAPTTSTDYTASSADYTAPSTSYNTLSTGYAGSSTGNTTGLSTGGYTAPWSSTDYRTPSTSTNYAEPSSTGYNPSSTSTGFNASSTGNTTGPSTGGYTASGTELGTSTGYTGPTGTGYAGTSSTGYTGTSNTGYTEPSTSTGYTGTNTSSTGYTGTSSTTETGNVIAADTLALNEGPRSVIDRVFSAPVDSYATTTTTSTSTAPVTTSATSTSRDATFAPTSSMYTSGLADSDTVAAVESTGLNAPAYAPAQSIATEASQVVSSGIASSSSDTVARPSERFTASTPSKPTTTTGLQTSTIPETSTAPITLPTTLRGPGAPTIGTSARVAPTAGAARDRPVSTIGAIPTRSTTSAGATARPMSTIGAITTGTTSASTTKPVSRSMSTTLRGGRQDSREISPMGRGPAAAISTPERMRNPAAAAASVAASHSSPAGAVGGHAPEIPAAIPEGESFRSSPATLRSAPTASPSSSTGARPEAGKKEKRRSFFGRIKDKLRG